jgi:xanthine/CO dehydrogenase XdhC/CoxF family maturation factor
MADTSFQYDPLTTAQEWKIAGRQVAIATVVETWGSAPCAPGSHLVIDREANFEGSVSGGCVESEVISEAANVIDSGTAKILEIGVSDERAWSVGLSCGGRVRIYIESLVK